MLDQVVQNRVDQQMMALIGAIRSAVTGNTGLSQGQTALAVVQVPQNAAAQNQNPGQSGAQTGQNAAAGTNTATTQSPAPASGRTVTAPAQQPQTAQQQLQSSAAALTQQLSQQFQALAQQSGQPISQAAAQALAQQVNAQTAAALNAALSSAIAASALPKGTGTALAAGNLQPLLQALAPAIAANTASTALNISGNLPNATGQATPVTAQTGVTGSATVQAGAAGNTSPAGTASSATAPAGAGAGAGGTGAAASAGQNTPLPANTPVRLLIPQTGQSVELTQIRPLPAGTQVTIRQTSASQVDILRVQLPQTSTANTNTQTTQLSPQQAERAALQQTAMTALREALPLQKPVTETLNRIQSLLPQLPSAVRDNPGVQQALQTLNNATLKLQPQSAPSAQAVRDSVQRSGVFHEAVAMQALQQAALAPAGTAIKPVGDDLKGAFFQIFRQLTRAGNSAEGGSREAPASGRGGAEAADGRQNTQNQLVRSLQEGLARIRSNQLQSAPATRGAEAGAQAGIQTDLPVLFNQQLSEVKVKIEQEVWPEDQQPAPGESYEKRWVINLTFSPPQLGQLHARLLYQNETLSTHLWVEEDDSLPSVSRQLHELKQRLSAIGIVIDEVKCQCGKPEQQPAKGVVSLKA